METDDFLKFFALGTPGYIAPELENQVGLNCGEDYFKCDVFSLGKLILNLLRMSESIEGKKNINIYYQMLVI